MPSTAAMASISSRAFTSSIIAMQVTCASCAAMCSANEARRNCRRGWCWRSRGGRRDSGRRRRSPAPSFPNRHAARGRPMAPQSRTERMLASLGSPTRTMAAVLDAAGCQDDDVDRRPVEGGVLLVDDDEVEAERAQDLRRDGSSALDERAEEVLARLQPLPELRVVRSRRVHAAGSPGANGPRTIDARGAAARADRALFLTTKSARSGVLLDEDLAAPAPDGRARGEDQHGERREEQPGADRIAHEGADVAVREHHGARRKCSSSSLPRTKPMQERRRLAAELVRRGTQAGRTGRERRGRSRCCSPRRRR